MAERLSGDGADLAGVGDGGATQHCSGAQGIMGVSFLGGVRWITAAESSGSPFIAAARWDGTGGGRGDVAGTRRPGKTGRLVDGSPHRACVELQGECTGLACTECRLDPSAD